MPRSALLLLGTIAGVAIGRRIESRGHSAAYVGTQLILAILVALVPDSSADAEISPGLGRLAGILAGMLVPEPILLIWYGLEECGCERRDVTNDTCEHFHLRFGSSVVGQPTQTAAPTAHVVVCVKDRLLLSWSAGPSSTGPA